MLQNITTSQITKPTTLNDKIERYLYDIFEKELNAKDSILISYTSFVVKKIAAYLSGRIKMPASIGIAGETASGKSTITMDLIDTIESFATEFNIDDAITRVNTDDYYYDRSEMVKAAGSFSEFAKNYDLDVPEALELELMKKHIKSLLFGNKVYLPEYDMSGTAIRRDNKKLALPSKIIISEGLFTLTDKVVDAFDFKIYVDVSSEVQKERFYKRAEQRGLGDSACEVYKNALDKAKTHIHPTAQKADIILSGEADRVAYRMFINKILMLVKDLYF